MDKRSQRGQGPEGTRREEIPGEGQEVIAPGDAMTRVNGLEKGQYRLIRNEAAEWTPALPGWCPYGTPGAHELGISETLICGRSDLLYFRSHEVNLHSKFKNAL